MCDDDSANEIIFFLLKDIDAILSGVLTHIAVLSHITGLYYLAFD